MFKYAILATVGVLAIILTGYSVHDSSTDKIGLFGTAFVEVHDKDGRLISTQTVHNRLTDQGETRILSKIFMNSYTYYASNKICLTNANSFTPTETMTAAQFDTDSNLDTSSNSPCKFVTPDVTTTQGKGVIGPIVFVGGSDIAVGSNIVGIGICNISYSGGSYTKCYYQSDDVLFAAVDTTDITNLLQDQSVTVRYEFDLRTPDT
jgi:hypothetical protein